MALAYTNVKVEIREISLRNRPKELYEVSQKGTVPVLITIDGLVIDESLEIMLWTLKNNLNQTWLIKNHNKEIEMIFYLKNGLIDINTMIDIQKILKNIIEKNVMTSYPIMKIN